ncbi:MAG: UDP-N-acetylmuramoyl-tripeptide--D-alanyl-D-alanine ligase [Saccharofermentans sp.]|nr:UDP-N-acetylmuramoyl-tripeptide--D-alanyl-D-alanine ligase [Saccharofermentans sp.]
MRNMMTLEEVSSAVNGKVVNKSVNGYTPIHITGVSKDTRTIEEGNIYVAIDGERFKGHDFTSNAIESGASCVLVNDADKIPAGAVGIVVEDTVKALGDLARAYRFKLGAKVICVTGSVGKTSTREMIACALSSSFKVFSTKRNENNEIGLPMTILTAPEDTEVLVLELGMRLRGEIAYLTEVACPDIAVITNVGYSHIERLGSQKEILLAKSEITEGLTEGGILAVNADDELLFNYSRDNVPIGNGLAGVRVTTDTSCPTGEVMNCPVMVTGYDVDFEDGCRFKVNISSCGKDFDVKLGLNGIHNVRNALFALLCAHLTGADMTKTTEALSSYEQMNGRGKVTDKDGIRIINDAYNAAPESMKAAFFNLDIMGRGRRKVAVLGGMLELGDYAPLLHEQVGKDCGAYDIDKIFVTGDNKEDFLRGLLAVRPEADCVLCEDTADIKKKIESFASEGDCILFKASNAFGFEKLAKEMAEETVV